MPALYLPSFTSLNSAIASIFGNNIRIVHASPVAGGDINKACRLKLTNGMSIFMKANRKDKLSFFTAEAAGLEAIAHTGEIGTPELLCYGTDEDRGGFSFLLMEWIQGERRSSHYWETFANQLAAMHRAPAQDFITGGRYGFHQNNYIGASPQTNTAYDSWVTFFRDCRLEPQIRSAENYFGPGDLKRTGWLLDHLGDFLVEPQRPSLLHGDLWSGNVILGNDGKAWLIDPAVYVGHVEADIAMTELFGGFPQELSLIHI